MGRDWPFSFQRIFLLCALFSSTLLPDPGQAQQPSERRLPIEQFLGQFGIRPVPIGPSALSDRPTIDCNRLRNSVAQILCSDRDGAAADWALNATIWALSHQVGDSGRAGFESEQSAWRGSLSRVCSLPPLFAGPIPRGASRCVQGAFQQRAEQLRSRLSPDALAEARLAPEQRAAFQRRLIEESFLQGTADGEFGPTTREAIKKFQVASGLEPTGFMPLARPNVANSNADFDSPRSENRQPRAEMLPAPANPPPSVEPQVADSTPNKKPYPSGRFAKTKLSDLLDQPSACEQLGRSQPQINSIDPAHVCQLVAQCSLQLNERAAAVDSYLKESPEVSRALRNKKLSNDVQSMSRDFGTALLKVTFPNSQDCVYTRYYIDRFWIRLQSNSSYGSRRPFEAWIEVGRSLLSDFRNILAEDERTYKDLLTNTDPYPGRDALVSQFADYEQSMLAEDFESALRARPILLNKFETGKQRKQLLSEQEKRIRSQIRLVADWTDQLSGSLATLADETIISGVRQLKIDLETLADHRSEAKIDISSDLNALSIRIEQARPPIEALINASRRSKELSDARALVLSEIPTLKQRLTSLTNPRFLSSEGQKIANLDKLSIQLAEFRPEELEKLDEFQTAIKASNTTLSELRTAISQQEDVDSLCVAIEKLSSKVSSQGRDLLDSKTESTIVDLVSQLLTLQQMQFPLDQDRMRTFSKAKESFDRVALNIDAALMAGKRRQEVRRLGDQYARDSGTQWSLDQKINPMTDKIEYKVFSLQKNDEGAVAEIEGRCVDRGVIGFTALIIDENGKPTISFPQYNSVERVLLGNRRINGADSQTAVFLSDQFNNRFFVLFLLVESSQSAQAQPDKSHQRGTTEDMRLAQSIQTLSKVMQISLVGAQKVDETWRVLVEIETSRGSHILKIPTFDRNIRKLIDSCA